jgi:hypothetical protein
MATRDCPFCGKQVFDKLTQCPYCRESLSQAPKVRPVSASDGGAQIRRGLLCVLLATVIGYFAGGYSPLNLPTPVMPIITAYLSPFLFLCGLGLTVHGYYLQHKDMVRTSR